MDTPKPRKNPIISWILYLGAAFALLGIFAVVFIRSTPKLYKGEIDTIEDAESVSEDASKKLIIEDAALTPAPPRIEDTTFRKITIESEESQKQISEEPEPSFAEPAPTEPPVYPDDRQKSKTEPSLPVEPPRVERTTDETKQPSSGGEEDMRKETEITKQESADSRDTQMQQTHQVMLKDQNAPDQKSIPEIAEPFQKSSETKEPDRNTSYAPPPLSSSEPQTASKESFNNQQGAVSQALEVQHMQGVDNENTASGGTLFETDSLVSPSKTITRTIARDPKSVATRPLISGTSAFEDKDAQSQSTTEKAVEKKLHAAFIHGDTGPEVFLYPLLALFGANGLYYFWKKRKKHK